jgi:predicted permease
VSDAPWRRYARLTGPDVAADVDDEMELHIQLLAEKLERQGLPPDEARARAVREFGDRARAKEECVRIGEARLREAQWHERWDTLWRDLRHALRRLRKSPAFAAVTVLTLALGVGPNVAIFSIVNSVLLQPLPYADPGRLVKVFETFPLAGGNTGTGSVSYANFRDWRAQARSFAGLAIAGFTGSANLAPEGGGDPQRLSVAQVGADLFPLLGVRPLLGRGLAAGEDSVGAPPVVLLGEALWRRRFAADPGVVGRRIVLDGVATTVVGVLPERITFPNASTAVDAWQPLQVSLPPGQRGGHNYIVIGRLKPGVTARQADGEMRRIAAGIARQFPGEQEGRSAQVVPYGETVVGYVRPRLLVLLGAAGLVLLIAAANAASLLLARAAAREREVAVAAALGASRGRIAQQFLAESLLLSAAGAAVGFALAVVAVKGVRAGAGAMLPRTTEFHYDWRVVLFVAGTVLLTALLFGLAPALQASRGDVQGTLREGSRGASGGPGRSAFRDTLVVAQFAISLVLLAGAGLLLRTFAALLGTPTGMATAAALTMRVPVPVGSPRYETPAAALERFWEPTLERVRALPGVAGAGVITRLPLQEWGTNGNFTVVGRSYPTVADQPFAELRAVSPGYFAALGIAVLRGRDVARADGPNAPPVVVINDQLARTLFPNEEPVGKQLLFGPSGPNNPPNTIVGVVASVRQATLDSPPLAELYFPYSQAGGWGVGSVSLVVRARQGVGDPARLARAVQGAIRAVDPTQPVYAVRAMDEVIRRSIGDRRLYLGLLATFAGVALALAVAGIYGVISYAVTQRTREFGIRLALGSEVGRVQRLVVWHGARLALSGLAVGVPAAVAATRLLAGLLYGVRPWDPATFAGVAALLAAVSVVSSWLPSRRVARVDPIIAMRAE